MKNETLKRLGISALCAAVLTALAGVGAFNWIDNRMSDTLYQKRQAQTGKIEVIGIDEEALQAYGPYQNWDRNIMASALEALNADPNNKPAVVAIDTLYSGTTGTDADERLAKAAEDLGCVVTGASGEFGTKTELNENGSYTVNKRALLGYEESYDALKNASTIGHINAMYDTDGILRHAILYITKDDGTKVYSMAETVAELYSGGSIELPKTDKNGNFYVAYSAAPGDFYSGISIKDVIDGNVPSDYFAGKIVFIGPYAAGLADNVVTPIARAKTMYGVEYQANVVSQLLSGNFKTEASKALQLLVLFLISFAALYIFLGTKVNVSTIAIVVLIALGIGASILLYKNGIVIHSLWIPIGVFVVYIVSVIYNYLKSRAEKKAITQTFERYVDEAIVNELIKAGPEAIKLTGKSCEIAVLFVDIRGFTTMSEGMSAEQVVSILNEYLTMTSECVKKNKGTLDKFVGDCTMAFWGAPLPMEDPVYYAVQCAKDIIAGAAEISKDLQEKYGVPLNVGVGVNYGHAVVGDIGSVKRRDYTAIGDTVNTAARLEANAPAGEIYISRSVADALGDRIQTESLGATIKLKGKAEGFEVLRLL